MLCLCVKDASVRVLDAPPIVKADGYEYVICATIINPCAPENSDCVYLALDPAQFLQLAQAIVMQMGKPNVV